MQFLTRARIGTQLYVGFGIGILITCLIGALGLFQMRQINANVVQFADNWMPSVKALSVLESTANTERRRVLIHVLEPDLADKKRLQMEHDDLVKQKLEPALKAYLDLVSSPEEQKLADEMQKELRNVLRTHDRLLELSNQGDKGLDQARDLASDSSSKAFTEFIATLDRCVAINVEGANAERTSAQKVYSTAVSSTAILLLVAIGFGAAMALAITRRITSRLHSAVEVAKTVSAGDLSSSIETEGRDEVADLLRALGEMNDNLSQIVSTVRNSSDSIATGSQQVATGNADLSQRTEEQASALQQTAATMDELGTTVRQNSDSARTANDLAQNASDIAARGGNVVSQVVDTMRGIDQASKKIADIIGVIDGIAFQTNILALNAAVEAARAGEQGRGFAVVAGEVRVLAQRSAEAAKEIKSLINNSVERVAAGSALADQAGATMNEIVDSIARVTQIMGEIASSSAEQSSGVTQVGEAITQMDKVTQQNAALVEESAAAAESLKQQAETMVNAVAVFRLRQR
jgi:methyl-accepting chemotaxis protein